MVFRLFSFGRRKKGGRHTSNISQHQKGNSCSCVCGVPGGEAEQEREVARQKIISTAFCQVGAGRNAGRRVRYARWQWATGEAMCQQALVAVPGLALAGKSREHKLGVQPAPWVAAPGMALTSLLSQTPTLYLFTWLLWLHPGGKSLR